MTHHPDNLEEAFARLRSAAEADREACAHLPAAIEAMMFALLVRLLTQLQGMARAWAANRHPVPRQAGLSRSHARIASGLVPPRAERTGPFCHWLVSLHRNRGMRPAAPAPARPPRALHPRATPPEPAPA